MKEIDLTKTAEEVTREKPLDKQLDPEDANELRNFVGTMGNVYQEQFEGYKGKIELGAFLSYVYHEGIQLGLKLAIWKRCLHRQL